MKLFPFGPNLQHVTHPLPLVFQPPVVASRFASHNPHAGTWTSCPSVWISCAGQLPCATFLRHALPKLLFFGFLSFCDFLLFGLLYWYLSFSDLNDFTMLFFSSSLLRVVIFFFPAGAWVGLKDISRVMVLFASFLGIQIGLKGLETAMSLPVYSILVLKLLIASREDWVIL
jgi:hypothetical protein